MLSETKSDAESEGPNLVSPYSATGKSSGQGYAPEATLRDARMTTQTQTRSDEGENATEKTSRETLLPPQKAATSNVMHLARAEED